MIGSTPVSEPCRKHGVSYVGIYKWKVKFGGMAVSEAKRLKIFANALSPPRAAAP